MSKNEETFAQRVKRESNGFSKLNPKLVEREKATHTKHMIALVKKMGRPLSEKEYRELGNIL